MIEQVRALLQQRNVTSAVIIDDAFDDRPRPGDVQDARWDRFFDDVGEADEDGIAKAYGPDAYERQDVPELRRTDSFIDVVWKARLTVRAAGILFEEYERTQGVKRVELAPLQRLLEQDLGLTCRTFGRDEVADIASADIIFLDLFLGLLEDEEAIKRAIGRVRDVVAQRPQAPPNVVLLSASPRLEALGPRVRDEGELLGCQFRMVPKRDVADSVTMTERLYELILSYPDALRLNSFILAWKTALERAKTEFVRSIRTLDLADYANMQALILEAEGEPVGDYVLDLYDLHLHNVLEGNADLIRAGKALNEIKWSDYPPAQFMPSEEAINIMDGTLFHNQVRTTVEAEIDGDPKRARLGDIFLAPQADAGADAAGPLDAPAAPAARYAYVVLSQACDIQHGAADRLLLLRGTVQPYSLRQHGSKGQGPRTSVMQLGEERFAIEWDVLAPETWLRDDLPRRLDGGYRRARRFRTPFALQLQQGFIGRLGRVGTLPALPTRHGVGVRISIKNRAGDALLLAEASVDRGDAVCLVGRTERNALKEWLLLSERLQGEIRRNLRAIPGGDLPANQPQLTAARDDPEFYRRLKGGLSFARDSSKGTKPFKDTPYDVVQIFTRRVLEPGGPVDRSFHPIIVEIEIE
jgi:hypothetical protein